MPNYSGIWTEQAVMQAVGAGNWANVPGVPTGVTGTVLGATSVSVAFTAPTFEGIPATITSYTVTSSPGGITASGASSPITVTGLTTGTPYTFTVTATNASGTSSPSAASSSVTPVQIDYIEDVFSTGLYSASGGSETFSILGSVDMYTKGGLMWIKTRNAAASHSLIRPTLPSGGGLFCQSNTTAAQNSFSTTEFKVNSNNTVTMANGDINSGGSTYVSWNFAKQAKFFDVVTYTGTGVARTIAHSLGSVPGCIIVKCTNAAGKNWQVYHTSLGNASYINLNLTSASTSSSTIWNSTTPTSTVFSLGADGLVNDSGDQYVAYLFASNAGGFGLTGSDNVISCGSFTTDSSRQFSVNLGYEPQWVLQKPVNQVFPWQIVDTMRGFVVSDFDQVLAPNTSGAEGSSNNLIQPTATGFKSTGTGDSLYADETYIYIAIRRGPMKVPTSGTSVYNADTTITATTPAAVSGFVTDLMISTNRTNKATYNQMFWSNRLTANGYTSSTNTTAEQAGGAFGAWDTMNGSGTSALQSAGVSDMAWMFKRAPGFFDEVCYTGTGTYGATNHNLGVTPELVIYKSRSNAVNWGVIKPVSSIAYYDGLLNSNSAFTYYSNDPSVAGLYTSTQFCKYQDTSSYTYVAYLFATCAGISKVGSYTGTGALQTINCGFAAGARFVLIKRIDSTGDWYTYDSARGISSSNDPYLLMNSTAAEVTGTNYVDTTSVGFQVTAAAPAGLNASGGTYIFLAIA